MALYLAASQVLRCVNNSSRKSSRVIEPIRPALGVKQAVAVTNLVLRYRAHSADLSVAINWRAGREGCVALVTGPLAVD